MTLHQLSLSNFRNLKDTTLDLDERVNLILGENGAGKTSLLEAMSVITQGKSFRSSRLSHCITRSADHFMLFARLENHRCGFRYGKPKTEIRIDSEPAHRIADLAKITPVLIIDHQTIDLICGPPALRRQFIDWLVFHVEQGYAELWNKGQSILRQRNAILRQRKDLKLLDYWDDLLVVHSRKIDQLRRKALDTLLQDHEAYTFQFKSGFDDDYSRQLARDRERDIRQGHTTHAFTRADIHILVDGHPVNTTESRGQLKLLAFALKRRAIELLQESIGKTCVVLMDDIHSELDHKNVSKLYASLLKLPVQLFTTGLSTNSFPDFLKEGGRMFHVEHGMISHNSIR